MIVFFADAVVMHADDTLSMIRGGKTEWEFPSYPAKMTTDVLVYFPRLSILEGDYIFEFGIDNKIGEKVCQMDRKGVTIKDSNQANTLKINVTLPIPQVGEYTLICKCGPRAYTLPLVFKTPFDPSMN